MSNTAKANDLVLDFDLYPRNEVDGTNVRRLVEALEAGEELPPIIADKKSKRVVDGFHRVKAHIRHAGNDAEIPVEWRSYTSDEALWLDAVKNNAQHGRQLSPFDRARIIKRSDDFGISVETVADALSVPTYKLEELRARKTAKARGKTVPIKQTLGHLAGKNLSKRQREANERAGGMRPLFYVNQVINLVEGDLVDPTNEQLINAIHRLHKLLSDKGLVAA